MTCLYVAIKVHEPIAIEPKPVAQLSGGQFTVDDIEACERRLLPGLGWRMNPPTTMSFVGLQLRDLSLSPCVEQQVLQLTKMQLEASVQQYSVITITTVVPSVVAEAAVSNGMRSIGYYRHKLSAVVLQSRICWRERSPVLFPAPRYLHTRSQSERVSPAMNQMEAFHPKLWPHDDTKMLSTFQLALDLLVGSHSSAD